MRAWPVVVLFLAAGSCDSPPTTAAPPAPASTPLEKEASSDIAAEPETKAPAAAKKLGTFASAEALDAFLEKNGPAHRRGSGYGSGSGAGFGGLGLSGNGMGGGGMGEGTIGLGSTGTIGSGGAGKLDSITNTQEEGVDEGGIIKVHGDHLVVLRRGRLFTVKVGDDTLEPIDAADVGPKGRHQAWYDEMLVHGDEVIVIGYSYAYRGTELARFDISADGKLRHTVTDVLRSNDYYSSRNYTSRLIGDTLVFYIPHNLGASWPTEGEEPAGVPAVCRAKGKVCDDWKGVVMANRVYRPVDETQASVLHTVVTCDLSEGAQDMQCEGRGILGPYSRNFYVSHDAVYVWVNDPTWTPPPPWAPKAATDPADAVLYRLGLKDDSVAALRTYGAPVDQFSFSQTADGHINVLVRAQGAGEGMWGAETSADDDVALLRTPLASFEDGTIDSAPPSAYTDLPDTAGQGRAFHNRFVGDVVLYGTGASWGQPKEGKTPLVAHRLSDASTTTLELEHPIDRIEPMGSDAVVVGASGSDLHFAAVDLASKPRAGGTHVEENANQGETRSHGFFYRPSAEREGTVGLPIRKGGSPGYGQLTRGSAKVLYLSASNLQFEPLGTLRSESKRKDRCKVSCVDWYGNARPVFLGDRVLALLGYEVVEGKRRGAMLVEERRVDMLDAL